MAYTKTTWVDEVLAGAERYEILDNAGDAVDAFGELAQCQIALATTVTTAGTTVNAAALNNIEEGVEDLATGAARSVKGVIGAVAGDVADIAAATDGHVLRRSGTDIGFGTIVAAGLASDAVITAKILNAAVTGPKLGNQGTTFPGSPATGERFFRTDLGFECYYDGTRWLTVNEYAVSANSAVYSSDSYPIYIITRQDYKMWITRITLAGTVATTNDGTNYWQLITKLRSLNPATTQTDIDTRTTAAWTAATYTLSEGAPGTANAGAGANTYWLSVFMYKSNSPGNITASISLYYRLIVT